MEEVSTSAQGSIALLFDGGNLSLYGRPKHHLHITIIYGGSLAHMALGTDSPFVSVLYCPWLFGNHQSMWDDWFAGLHLLDTDSGEPRQTRNS